MDILSMLAFAMLMAAQLCAVIVLCGFDFEDKARQAGDATTR
jgi:hypothetical protein